MSRLGSSDHASFVQRCWHDAEDLPATAEQIASDPLMRPLAHGEVGVSFFNRGQDLQPREILPESKLMLLDRMYQPGDLLKRSIDDLRVPKQLLGREGGD